METYTIDAAGKKIGRVASAAASALLGKNKTTFKKNTVLPIEVEVKNCSQMDLGEKRLSSIKIPRYSGYPGGLSFIPGKKILTEKGAGELLKLVIRGMLPKNTLRVKRLRNLKTHD